MNIIQLLLFLTVSLAASIVGAICGIGGGVIIKPALDLLGLADVSTISFLSSCTVLSMSCYSVGKSLAAHDSKVSQKTGLPLALGAAVGGICGQNLFSLIKSLFSNAERVGAVQAVCLLLVTLGALLFTIKKERIATLSVHGILPCILIGLILGFMSSFLGIGGGPINLVVLGFFFSMDTKTAAQSSLYIILLSQTANLLTILISRQIPDFDLTALILMIAGGIGGGIIGRKLNKKMDNRTVDKLFIGLMLVIMLICIYNTYRYTVS